MTYTPGNADINSGPSHLPPFRRDRRSVSKLCLPLQSPCMNASLYSGLGGLKQTHENAALRSNSPRTNQSGKQMILIDLSFRATLSETSPYARRLNKPRPRSPPVLPLTFHSCINSAYASDCPRLLKLASSHQTPADARPRSTAPKQHERRMISDSGRKPAPPPATARSRLAVNTLTRRHAIPNSCASTNLSRDTFRTSEPSSHCKPYLDRNPHDRIQITDLNRRVPQLLPLSLRESLPPILQAPARRSHPHSQAAACNRRSWPAFSG